MPKMGIFDMENLDLYGDNNIQISVFALLSAIYIYIYIYIDIYIYIYIYILVLSLSHSILL